MLQHIILLSKHVLTYRESLNNLQKKIPLLEQTILQGCSGLRQNTKNKFKLNYNNKININK